ncbi:MAG: DUF1501 domain-containing protein [Burkholderiales bacterium]|nr:DUF1501 domain-containing protein [Opitutaceae bacterium]
MGQPLSRREFLGQGACAGLGLAGLLSTIGTLRLFNSTVSAQTVPGDDHKALVCLFLFGGNDGNNTLIPYDAAGYATYAASRGILALPRTNLVRLTLAGGGDGREWALHPSLSPLGPIFDAGKMSVLTNVGTLVAPITQAEYKSGGAAIPPYLFSHNDQQVQWQTSVPDSTKRVGWGGRLADHLQALNAGSQISMNVSLAGNNYFQVGEEVFQYHVTPEGSVGLENRDASWAPFPQANQALDDTLGRSYGHLFEQEYAKVMKRAVRNDALLKTTLAAIPRYDRGPGSPGYQSGDLNLFPRSRTATGALTRVASQLHMILRLIVSNNALALRRQVFFSSLGGWDTHDDQLNDHGALLAQLGNALADFYQATVTLGVSEEVTLFTASDFNRTFSTNGKGSDHAWGSHHLVLGGGVNGGRLVGRMPVLQSGGPDDTGDRGAWIPGISTDEYAATLARWFGVSDANLPLVLPNIGRFARRDLGFMNL